MTTINQKLFELANSYWRALEGGELLSTIRLHAHQASVNIDYINFKKIDRYVIYNVFLAANAQNKIENLVEVIQKDGFELNYGKNAIENGEWPFLEIEKCVFYIPTSSFVDSYKKTLLKGKIKNPSYKTKKVFLKCYIDGFTDVTHVALDVPPGETRIPDVNIPIFKPEKLKSISQTVIRAHLNFELYIPDLQLPVDIFQKTVLLTQPEIILIAQKDEDGTIIDFSNTLAWLVNSGAPGLSNILVSILPSKTRSNLGYIDRNSFSKSKKNPFGDQVKSLLRGLQGLNFLYLPTEIIWISQGKSILQRVRKPEEIISDPQKRINCLDAAILFASFLEYMGLDPILVIVRNHALVGWKRSKGIELKEGFDLINASDFIDPVFLCSDKNYDLSVSSAQGYLIRDRNYLNKRQKSLEDFTSIIDIKTTRSSVLHK